MGGPGQGGGGGRGRGGGRDVDATEKGVVSPRMDGATRGGRRGEGEARSLLVQKQIQHINNAASYVDGGCSEIDLALILVKETKNTNRLMCITFTSRNPATDPGL